jgi:hypothetical protein
VLNIAMRKSPKTNQEAAAAELALKAHVLASDPEITAYLADGKGMMQEIAETVDLTEAPEDAVASLVIDLMHYCEREKIDWSEDVRARAKRYLQRREAV